MLLLKCPPSLSRAYQCKHLSVHGWALQGGTTPLLDALVADRVMENAFGLKLCDESPAVSNQSLLVLGYPTAPRDLYTGSLVYTPLFELTYYNVIVTGMAIDDVPLGACTQTHQSLSPAQPDHPRVSRAVGLADPPIPILCSQTCRARPSTRPAHPSSTGCRHARVHIQKLPDPTLRPHPRSWPCPVPPS